MSREEKIIHLVERIRPLLAGLAPDIQGAVLADLTAIWLAGHPPQCRADVLDLQYRFIRRLIDVNDAIMFGPAGHPNAWPNN